MGRTLEQAHVDIDYSTIKQATDFTPIYHSNEDIFFLRTTSPREAVSLDWDGDIWLRIDPKTGEIVGLEIADFEAVFLKKYPGLASAWKEAKPLCIRKKTGKPEEINCEAFLRIILEFLKTLLRENPLQSQFAV